MGLRDSWQRLPPRVRTVITTLLKTVVTVCAFYLLLTHEVRDDSGQHVTAYRAILDYLPNIDSQTFWTWILVGCLVRAVGIVASMTRWYLLLIGQGIRLPFLHIVSSFLIGRFIGTFLPSTIGLDGYKLYDAARFSGRTVEATAATVVEKVLGVVGMFLCFLLTFPLGYDVLGDRATLVASVTVPLAVGVIGGFFLLMVRPTLFQWLLRNLPIPGRARVAGILDRVMGAATAYRGQGGLLAQTAVLSFLVHFCTAAMYYFTALAIGAASADFWEVAFASTIQIFATVISPFTIAGEGVREIVQTLLLAGKIGASASILSAALGFWAAEVMTMGGGVLYLLRRSDYRPAFVELSKRGG